jgi:sugar phosphate permease
MAAPERSRRRWLVLAVGLTAMTAGCAVQYGLAYLIPALRAEDRSLEEATFLASAPIAGILVTLIAWGVATDRWGERWVLVSGLAASGVALLGATLTTATPARWALLFLAGATSAAIHGASGRLVLGWFAAEERGLAMGIRQMGQPLGVGAAAIALPGIAIAGGVSAAFVALAAAGLGAAVLVLLTVTDPTITSASEPEGRSPYRGGYLARIHLASALLVVPQFAVAVFAFDYLVTALGWSPASAGALLAGAAVAGAIGRLVVGWWSDRRRARLAPMRTVAVVIALSMSALAVAAATAGGAGVALLLVASVVTVAPNGLAYTAVAERAGPAWAGRALGIQNTGQNLVAALAAVPLAALIGLAGGGAAGYGAAWAVAALLPLAAAVLIPVRRERPPD